MPFEADIIKALQTLSNPILDTINTGLSFFGTEMFFMIVAVILYWCVDKSFAHKFFNVYILGVAVTNVLKMGFKRPRPFNAYPDTVKSIGEGETTYSFPSGHTESISSVSALLCAKYGRKHIAIPIIFSLLTVAVMFSRIYLGQHYLSDVFCGLTVGVFCAIVFDMLLSLLKDKEEWFAVGAIVVTAVAIGILAGLKMINTAGGGDILKGLGAFVAFDIGYFIEKRFVKYDIKANGKWYAYCLRLIIGIFITVLIQQTFKLFLPQRTLMLYNFLRYFIMALWVSLIAPALFKGLHI